MTDKQRKEIERAFSPNPKLTHEQANILNEACNNYAADCESLYEDGLETTRKVAYLKGAAIGLSLSHNRIKELEETIKKIHEITLLHHGSYAHEIYTITKQLLNHSDNDKKQEG